MPPAAAAGEPSPLAFCMWDGGGPGPPLRQFPLASRPINDLMPRLLAAVRRCPVLRPGPGRCLRRRGAPNWGA